MNKKNSVLLLTLLLIVSAITVTSCGDDKDEPTSENSIVGVWRHDFRAGYQLLTYNQNGTYSLVEIDYESGNWSEQGTYTVSNNIITRYDAGVSVDNPEYKMVFTILSLTQTKLLTRYEGQYVGQFHDDDVEEWTRVE